MPADDLTPRQVAERLGVTVRTVQRWISNGRLPAHRVGARFRVSPSSLGEPAGRPIRTLLIANRGEIAARIARTARALGMQTIAVRTDDEPTPSGSETMIEIGSYLDADALVRAARSTGADAIHPGYGFLAENAAFAQAVIDAGLVWVGPPPAAIAAMGDKAAARRTAAEQGVPTVSGYDGAGQSNETLRGEALRIGLPILVKPSAGGGGKGMRVVREAADLEPAFAAARREARAAFGDERLILERFLPGPRHVEVQILCDAHGDGGASRRARLQAASGATRRSWRNPRPSCRGRAADRMGSAALQRRGVASATSRGNRRVPPSTDDGQFHFLEMNTRLQVEHAVTEAGHRARPRRRPAADRGGRAARGSAARDPAQWPRHRGAPVRGGPGVRLSARHGPSGAPGLGRTGSASTPACGKASWSPTDSTRCSRS